MQCIYYKNKARLQLTHRPPVENVDCFSVHWESVVNDLVMKDCFVMDNGETGAWWGLGDVTGGAIPLTKIDRIRDTTLFSGEIQKHPIGGLLRRVWISSKGVLISIPLSSNAIFSVNANSSNLGEFCLSSQFDRESNLENPNELAVLDYTVCTGSNVKDLLKSLHDIECMNEVEYSTSKWHSFRHPLPSGFALNRPSPSINSSITNIVMKRLSCPVWRPWLSHNEGKIDQEDVLTYAESIASNMKDVCGDLLLPVTWQNKLGVLEFDSKRFPDPKLMKESLLRKGLRLALTLSAHVDTNTQTFKEATNNAFLIKQINSTLPILVSSYEGETAGVLDFTNPNTMDWFEMKLLRIVGEYGIDRFHVSPITTLTLPPYRHQHNPSRNPDYALGKFAETVSRIRAPISTEAIVIPVPPPTFLTAGNGDASWEMLEMLPNRILSISSVGGNLVDSGVVGGWSSQRGHIPDQELYIRWMQASIFLPAFQMSVLPNMYSEKLKKHAETLFKLRKEEVLPRFMLGIEESLQNGYPLTASLAMVFPTDPKSLKIGDQWMVGKDLMVAPVLKRGRKSRDIYLPPGIWKDTAYDRLLKGKRWLKNYPVLLQRVPYFINVTPEKRKGKNGMKKKNQKLESYIE